MLSRWRGCCASVSSTIPPETLAQYEELVPADTGILSFDKLDVFIKAHNELWQRLSLVCNIEESKCRAIAADVVVQLATGQPLPVQRQGQASSAPTDSVHNLPVVEAPAPELHFLGTAESSVYVEQPEPEVEIPLPQVPQAAIDEDNHSAEQMTEEETEAQLKELESQLEPESEELEKSHLERTASALLIKEAEIMVETAEVLQKEVQEPHIPPPPPPSACECAGTRCSRGGHVTHGSTPTQISAEQFRKFHENYMVDPKGQNEFFNRTVFAAFDANRDGVLNKEVSEHCVVRI